MTPLLLVVVYLVAVVAPGSSQRLGGALFSRSGAGTAEVTQLLRRALEPDEIPRFVGCITKDPSELNCDPRSGTLACE